MRPVIENQRNRGEDCPDDEIGHVLKLSVLEVLLVLLDEL